MLCWCVTGCATQSAHLRKDLLAEPAPPERLAQIHQQYTIGCPDELDVKVRPRPEFNGRYVVQVDGRIDLGSYGRVRLEGQAPPEAAERLAAELGVPRDDVSVRVAAYRSQHLLVVGQVLDAQRTVAYQGPETVIELLQRAGGITRGAEPDEVFVIRPHLAENHRPEVFRIDLRQILNHHNDRSNIHVRPFDQVHIGETRQFRVEKIFPPWLRPLYQSFWNTLPSQEARAGKTQAEK